MLFQYQVGIYFVQAEMLHFQLYIPFQRLVCSIDHRNIMVSTLHCPDTVSVIAKGLFGIGANTGINEQWLLILV
jgi:hypothetical protein